jgi:DNA-binding response OmpR family regulator
MRVLLIEDDQLLARLVERSLGEAGFAVEHTGSAAEGCARAAASDYDVVLLDLGLPDRPGLEVVRALRRAGRTMPIVILTGRDEEADIVRGLDAGADDYLLKPVTAAVLQARVRAAVRRGGATRRERLVLGPLVLHRLTRQVHVAPGAAADGGTADGGTADGVAAGGVAAERADVEGGPAAGVSGEGAAGEAAPGAVELPLTPKEFAMLEHFLLHAEEVVPRSELLERVWNMHFDPGSNVVDAHVARLRQKLRAATARPELRTVRGVGFVLTMR